MADIATLIDLRADATAVYRALTTTEGVAGWWTTRNTTTDQAGAVNEYRFPGMPTAYEMRVDEAVAGKRVSWHCVGGPPQWIGTDVRFTLEAAPDGAGTRVIFDHTGFPAVDEMFRAVTMGWVQMLLRLRDYVDNGTAVPYFDF
jgi:uncharacterized protein YndB with AHSA1/START domain